MKKVNWSNDRRRPKANPKVSETRKQPFPAPTKGWTYGTPGYEHKGTKGLKKGEY